MGRSKTIVRPRECDIRLNDRGDDENLRADRIWFRQRAIVSLVLVYYFSTCGFLTFFCLITRIISIYSTTMSFSLERGIIILSPRWRPRRQWSRFAVSREVGRWSGSHFTVWSNLVVRSWSQTRDRFHKELRKRGSDGSMAMMVAMVMRIIVFGLF